MMMFGAGGRTRTDMSVTSPDFESGAYTNFATPALRKEDNTVSRFFAQQDSLFPTIIENSQAKIALGSVIFRVS